MSRLLICLVLFCVFKVTVIQAACGVQGYYWRDFNGDIPEDALVGGSDAKGRSTFIAQVFSSQYHYLIPAKLYSDDQKAYYEYGGVELYETKNIKVLCSQHPEQFEWIKTSNDDIKLLTDKQLVIGGYEPGATTYIGRVRFQGEVVVGKALTDNAPENAGLHITKDGQKAQYTSFEVLAYNSSKSPKCQTQRPIVINIFSSNENVQPISYVNDYIWKDFDGEIPPDALDNGFNKNGKTVYIGQVLYQSRLLPGKIYDGDNKIYFYWQDKELSTDQNVKVFCTSNPHHFQWVSTRDDELIRLKGKILINGGHEDDFDVYVGRVFEDGEVNVGKILCKGADCRGLYTTSNGITNLHHVFQILAYNPRS